VKDQTRNLQQAAIAQLCKEIHIPMVGANFAALAEEARLNQHDHLSYLEAVLQTERDERERHAIANRLKEASLPRFNTLEDFDFAQAPQLPTGRIRELAEGGYIERREPVVLIGECGTGKTHLASGLAVAACRQRRRVRSATASALSMNWWKPSRPTASSGCWPNGCAMT
jgi:DNA replication protein DnaC